MTDTEGLAVRATPAEVRIPWWLAVALAGGVVGGGVLGAGDAARPAGQRVAGAVFLGAALGYLGISLVDFWEHLRLERIATGRYTSMVAVPPGETLNHLATVAVIVGVLVLARPLGGVLEARDLFVLGAPGVVLALGWRDELVYHRRRAAHREDIMHTTAHLALGAMFAGLSAARLVPWGALAGGSP